MKSVLLRFDLKNRIQEKKFLKIYKNIPMPCQVLIKQPKSETITFEYVEIE